MRIAVTPGEPAGVGPDLILALAAEDWDAELIVVADPELLTTRAALLKRSVKLDMFEPDRAPEAHRNGRLKLLPVALETSAYPGTLNPSNGRYVLETLHTAARGCVQKQFSAMVTGPVHKSVINDAGVPFSGHTEFLAELTGGDPVMLLTTDNLRVALATTHLPLADVSEAITPARLQRVIRVLDHDLRKRFNLPSPRISVCGLNPHAGEGGHLGREEIEIISPTLEHLRGEGINLRGPLPADTLFTPQNLEHTDAVLAMYHDQGLPVLKYVGFGAAVNVTLGLPIIRTSVDHGTALELAGTGKANAGSLRAAIKLAIRLAEASVRADPVENPNSSVA